MGKRPISGSSAKKAPAANSDVRLIRVPGLPEIRRGEDLSEQITIAARKMRMHFENGDILAIAQKIVSKHEGAIVRLERIETPPPAQAVALRKKKDPRLVQLCPKESSPLARAQTVLIPEIGHA